MADIATWWTDIDELEIKHGLPHVDYVSMGALFSECHKYRYALWRTWDVKKPVLCWLMLNPSTADESHSDPTNTRCERYAKDWGYGSHLCVNLFAYRAKDPKDMKAQGDPVGPFNDDVLFVAMNNADKIVGAWGTHGTHRKRDKSVIDLAKSFVGAEINALRVTKEGHPSHPLYLPACLTPTLYIGAHYDETQINRLWQKCQTFGGING